MSDSKLEPFKIGDTRKPTVTNTTQKATKEEAPQAYSLGFKRIEGILETEELATVNANLDAIRQKLEELQKQGANNKEKAAAKKAIIALERTADLMEYLFQTKQALQASAK